jgi:uncharacterized membrane protein
VEARFSESGSRLAAKISTYMDAAREELAGMNYISRQRAEHRRMLVASGGLFLGIGILIALGAIISLTLNMESASEYGITISTLVLGLGGGVIILAVMTLVYGLGYSPLTEPGLQESSKWAAFLAYLKNVSNGKEPVTRPDMFEQYLPYAAALGISEKWVKFFKQRGEAELPAWFRTAAADYDASMAAFVVLMSASSSSGAGGAGGAGGSAGGGGSGAG